MVRVDEDTCRCASRLDQNETTWRNAILEQSLSFAEHNGDDPHPIFVDKSGADQRL
jgi:hypothetical protein